MSKTRIINNQSPHAFSAWKGSSAQISSKITHHPVQSLSLADLVLPLDLHLALNGTEAEEKEEFENSDDHSSDDLTALQLQHLQQLQLATSSDTESMGSTDTNDSDGSLISLSSTDSSQEDKYEPLPTKVKVLRRSQAQQKRPKSTPPRDLGEEHYLRSVRLQEYVNKRTPPPKPPVLPQHPKASIHIIGMGVAGCDTALRLAEKGYLVYAHEAESDILSRSSNATPCRLGLGFHYPDEKTALSILEHSVKLMLEYSNFRITDDEARQSMPQLGRGHYFLMKDSKFSPDETRKIFAAIRKRYSELCNEAEDPVFGPPEDLYCELAEEKYKDHVDASKVALAFETAETFLDWPRLREHLSAKVKRHPNIRLLTNSKVVNANAKCNEENESFTLWAQNTQDGTLKPYTADIIVNASWENIEQINHLFGVEYAGSRTNRTKVMVRVGLPEDRIAEHSKLGCYGPFSSFTNLGDGTGFLTYEPVTNVEMYTSLEVPPLSKRLLAGGATESEKREFGRKIIEGASQFIPWMKDAVYLDAQFGNVRIEGAIESLNSADSQINKRRELGVKEQMLGLISNASMKLIHFSENGKTVLDLVQKHIDSLPAVKAFAAKIMERFTKSLSKSTKQTLSTAVIERYIRRHIQLTCRADDQINYESSADEVMNKVYLPVMQYKNKINTLFRSMAPRSALPLDLDEEKAESCLKPSAIPDKYKHLRVPSPTLENKR